jgi:hypothetical protein
VGGPTAGRYFIDVTSGVTPKQFIKGEYFVTTALLASYGMVGLRLLRAPDATLSQPAPI